MADIKEFLDENWLEDTGYTTDYDSLISMLDDNGIEYAEYSTSDDNDLDAVDKVVVYGLNGDECTTYYFVNDVLVQVDNPDE